MVGKHHQLKGQEYEQTLGDGEGQGGLACCSPWDPKIRLGTEQLNICPRIFVKQFYYIILLQPLTFFQRYDSQ